MSRAWLEAARAQQAAEGTATAGVAAPPPRKSPYLDAIRGQPAMPAPAPTPLLPPRPERVDSTPERMEYRKVAERRARAEGATDPERVGHERMVAVGRLDETQPISGDPRSTYQMGRDAFSFHGWVPDEREAPPAVIAARERALSSPVFKDSAWSGPSRQDVQAAQDLPHLLEDVEMWWQRDVEPGLIDWAAHSDAGKVLYGLGYSGPEELGNTLAAQIPGRRLPSKEGMEHPTEQWSPEDPRSVLFSETKRFLPLSGRSVDRNEHMATEVFDLDENAVAELSAAYFRDWAMVGNDPEGLGAREFNDAALDRSQRYREALSQLAKGRALEARLETVANQPMRTFGLPEDWETWNFDHVLAAAVHNYAGTPQDLSAKEEVRRFVADRLVAARAARLMLDKYRESNPDLPYFGGVVGLDPVEIRMKTGIELGPDATYFDSGQATPREPYAAGLLRMGGTAGVQAVGNPIRYMVSGATKQRADELDALLGEETAGPVTRPIRAFSEALHPSHYMSPGDVHNPQELAVPAVQGPLDDYVRSVFSDVERGISWMPVGMTTGRETAGAIADEVAPGDPETRATYEDWGQTLGGAAGFVVDMQAWETGIVNVAGGTVRLGRNVIGGKRMEKAVKGMPKAVKRPPSAVASPNPKPTDPDVVGPLVDERPPYGPEAQPPRDPEGPRGPGEPEPPEVDGGRPPGGRGPGVFDPPPGWRPPGEGGVVPPEQASRVYVSVADPAEFPGAGPVLVTRRPDGEITSYTVRHPDDVEVILQRLEEADAPEHNGSQTAIYIHAPQDTSRVLEDGSPGYMTPGEWERLVQGYRPHEVQVGERSYAVGDLDPKNILQPEDPHPPKTVPAWVVEEPSPRNPESPARYRVYRWDARKEENGSVTWTPKAMTGRIESAHANRILQQQYRSESPRPAEWPEPNRTYPRPTEETSLHKTKWSAGFGEPYPVRDGEGNITGWTANVPYMKDPPDEVAPMRKEAQTGRLRPVPTFDKAMAAWETVRGSFSVQRPWTIGRGNPVKRTGSSPSPRYIVYGYRGEPLAKAATTVDKALQLLEQRFAAYLEHLTPAERTQFKQPTPEEALADLPEELAAWRGTQTSGEPAPAPRDPASFEPPPVPPRRPVAPPTEPALPPVSPASSAPQLREVRKGSGMYAEFDEAGNMIGDIHTKDEWVEALKDSGGQDAVVEGIAQGLAKFQEEQAARVIPGPAEQLAEAAATPRESVTTPYGVVPVHKFGKGGAYLWELRDRFGRKKHPEGGVFPSKQIAQRAAELQRRLDEELIRRAKDRGEDAGTIGVALGDRPRGPRSRRGMFTVPVPRWMYDPESRLGAIVRGNLFDYVGDRLGPQAARQLEAGYSPNQLPPEVVRELDIVSLELTGLRYNELLKSDGLDGRLLEQRNPRPPHPEAERFVAARDGALDELGPAARDSEHAALDRLEGMEDLNPYDPRYTLVAEDGSVVNTGAIGDLEAIGREAIRRSEPGDQIHRGGRLVGHWRRNLETGGHELTTDFFLGSREEKAVLTGLKGELAPRSGAELTTTFAGEAGGRGITTRSGHVMHEAWRRAARRMVPDKNLVPLGNGAMIPRSLEGRYNALVNRTLPVKRQAALTKGGTLLETEANKIRPYLPKDVTVTPGAPLPGTPRQRAQVMRQVVENMAIDHLGEIARATSRMNGAPGLRATVGAWLSDAHRGGKANPDSLKGQLRTALGPARPLLETVGDAFWGNDLTNLDPRVRGVVRKYIGKATTVRDRILARTRKTRNENFDLDVQQAQAEVVSQLAPLTPDELSTARAVLDKPAEYTPREVYEAREQVSKAADLGREWLRINIDRAGGTASEFRADIGEAVDQATAARLYAEVVGGELDGPVLAKVYEDVTRRRLPNRDAGTYFDPLEDFAMQLLDRQGIEELVYELLAVGGAVRVNDPRIPLMRDVLTGQELKPWGASGTPVPDNFQSPYTRTELMTAYDQLERWGMQPYAWTDRPQNFGSIGHGVGEVVVPDFLMKRIQQARKTGQRLPSEYIPKDMDIDTPVFQGTINVGQNNPVRAAANHTLYVNKVFSTLATGGFYLMNQVIGAASVLWNAAGVNRAATTAARIFDPRHAGLISELVQRTGGRARLPQIAKSIRENGWAWRRKPNVVTAPRAPEDVLLSTPHGVYHVDELADALMDAGLAEGRATYDMVSSLRKQILLDDKMGVRGKGRFRLDRLRATPSWFAGSLRDLANATDIHFRYATLTRELQAGRSMKDALESARTATLDFRDITPFETNVMRNVFLWYALSRKLHDNWLQTLAMNPGRVFGQFRTMRNMIKYDSLTTAEQWGMRPDDRGRPVQYVDHDPVNEQGERDPRIDRVNYSFGTVGPEEWLHRLLVDAVGLFGDTTQISQGEALDETLFSLAPLPKAVTTVARWDERAPHKDKVPDVMLDMPVLGMLSVLAFDVGRKPLADWELAGLADPNATTADGRPAYWAAGAGGSGQGHESPAQAGRMLWRVVNDLYGAPIRVAQKAGAMAGTSEPPPYMTRADLVESWVRGTIPRPIYNEDEVMRREELDRKRRYEEAIEQAELPDRRTPLNP